MIKQLLKLKYIIISLLLLELTVSVMIFVNTQHKADTFVDNKTESAKVEYRAVYAKIKEQSQMIFQEQINTPEVINIFKSAYKADKNLQDALRKKLYSHLSSTYKGLNELIHLRQLHFHFPNNRSFLRLHKVDKFGDDLSGIRQTVEYVNREKKAIDGFEEGRIYNGFRFVYPLFDDKQIYIGSVETSFSVESFKQILDNELHASQFIILKSVVQEKVWDDQRELKYEEIGISPLFLIDKIEKNYEHLELFKRLRSTLTHKIKSDFRKKISQKEAFSLTLGQEETTFILTFLPVKNPISERVVAYMVLISEDTLLNEMNREFWILQMLALVLISIIFGFVFRNRINVDELISSEMKYRTIIENTRDNYFFYRHDTNMIFTYVSDSVTDILGYSKQEFMTNVDKYLTKDPINENTLKQTLKSIKGIKQSPYLVEIYHKNGSKHWLEVAETPIFDNKQRVVSVDGIAKDITQERRIDKLIGESQTILFYWKAQENWPVEYVSKNISYFGYSPSDFISGEIKFSDIIYPDDIQRVTAEVLHYTESFEDNFVQVYRILTADGSIRWIDDRTTIERNSQNTPVYYLGTIIDITEQKISEMKIENHHKVLQHKAEHDELTDLPNRALFLDRLSQAIKSARLSKTQIAVLFIDLDHFKEINDSIGHHAGDMVIQEVSKRLSKQIPDTNTLARLGGDEFIVILDGLTHSGGAVDMVKNLMNSMNEPIIIDNHNFYTTLSIGITIYPEDGNEPNILLKNADAAMYKAKEDGRNTYSFYNEALTEKAFERIVMESSLHQALKKEEFVVYYQAQIDGKTDTLIGLEALVRWEHPTMGLISPAKFISLAEETGLIIELDQWVMKTAMKQLVKWYEEGLNPGILALNLAMKQLNQKDFISILSSIIQETNCKVEWLELEVTESQIMHNPESAIKTLEAINNLGINLAIDDFGTGYSSLAYLKKLPINKLKIDQSFIRDLPYDEDDAGITKAVIALSQNLNLRVIAEGVETQEQKEFLVKNGCRNIQGYFYAKPMPAQMMRERLLNGFKKSI